VRVITMAQQYVQGPGALCALSKYMKALGVGSQPLVIADSVALETVGDSLKQGLGDLKPRRLESFRGEMSREALSHYTKEVARETGADVVVGVGGGRVLDLARAVGYQTKRPYVMVPTCVSTNAATSSVSCINDASGLIEEVLHLRTPDLVVVDSQIIAEAPARLLLAGMGDSLSTKIEVESCSGSRATTEAGGVPTLTGELCARWAYETILSDGESAKLAVETKLVVPALENVIEAINVLSGVGWMSGGCALVHAIENGLKSLPDTHAFFHGEKVAWAILADLIFEERSAESLQRLMEFYYRVGLPLTAANLGIADSTREKPYSAALSACTQKTCKGLLACMPMEIHPRELADALSMADVLGQKFVKDHAT